MLGTRAQQNLHRDNTQLIEKYNQELKEYKMRFKVFGDINQGDKIGKSGDAYHIYPSGVLQKITRWMYTEDRNTTFAYIDEDFKNFFSLCDRIKDSHLALTPNVHIKKTLVEIINIAIPGLYTLKGAYKNARSR